MYTQFQSITKEGEKFTSDNFQSQENFLRSLANDSDFIVYESNIQKLVQEEISTELVLKIFQIQAVKPKIGKNTIQLVFTAKEKNTKNVYEGLINWD